MLLKPLIVHPFDIRYRTDAAVVFVVGVTAAVILIGINDGQNLDKMLPRVVLIINQFVIEAQDLGTQKIGMRQLFEEARLNHLIIDNPTEGIKITPHAKAEKKKALLPDEVDILMSVVVEPRARVFCALCLYCGLRKEEALGLQWSDIQSNSLTVRRAMTFLNNQQDPVDDLKTKAAHRVIPIPDKLRAILLDTPHLSRYIVPASNGGDMTRSAFTRMWNSHVVSLVPFPLHPHMLRHTYATTLYRARVDLRTAQKLMGHSSIQVTADIYTHLEQEDSLHVADKLNEYLSGKSENSVKSSQKVVKLAI